MYRPSKDQLRDSLHPRDSDTFKRFWGNTFYTVPEAFTASQVGLILNCHETTVRRWFETGKMTFFRNPVGWKLVSANEIRRYLKMECCPAWRSCFGLWWEEDK